MRKNLPISKLYDNAPMVLYRVHSNANGAMARTSLTGIAQPGELNLVALGHSHTLGASVELWSLGKRVASAEVRL